MPATLAQLLSDLKEDEAKKYVKEALEKGTDPTKLLEEAKEGMSIVGQRFSSGEYFIPDLLYSGEIMKELVALLEPKLKEVRVLRLKNLVKSLSLRLKVTSTISARTWLCSCLK